MKKNIIILGVATVMMLFNSCKASWLEQYPEGSTITEGQFVEMEGALEGSVMGIYSLMYAFGGDHDTFGQRSIDMYGDFTCGDMAMSTQNYGWFATDDMGQSYTRRAYFWSYYYDMIRLCNKSLNAFNAQVDPEKLEDEAYIMEYSSMFYYYAEIIALRGWAYSNLQKWFCYTPSYLAEQGMDPASYKSIPLYTEEVTVADTILGNPLSTVVDVYQRIEDDLKTAIYYFDILESNGVNRAIKQEMNGDVARLTLAYNYLNAEDWAKAAATAEEFINNTKTNLLPREELTTTGFADINSNNWVWGQDVNVMTTTSLASFFGQCDIFSYSYAWAGDIKGIDANLLATITDEHEWDARALWFNNTYNTCNEKTTQYAPDGKFYSPSVKAKVGYGRKAKDQELDRDWLSDNVFMRCELGYLIAAEANARMEELSKAAEYLTAITDQRIIEGQESAYDTWKGTLSDKETLLAEIKYNWRVELWGEGFGMSDIMRLHKPVVRYNASTKEYPAAFRFNVEYGDPYMLLRFPQQEMDNNSALVDNTGGAQPSAGQNPTLKDGVTD